MTRVYCYTCQQIVVHAREQKKRQVTLELKFDVQLHLTSFDFIQQVAQKRSSRWIQLRMLNNVEWNLHPVVRDQTHTVTRKNTSDSVICGVWTRKDEYRLRTMHWELQHSNWRRLHDWVATLAAIKTSVNLAFFKIKGSIPPSILNIFLYICCCKVMCRDKKFDWPASHTL